MGDGGWRCCNTDLCFIRQHGRNHRSGALVGNMTEVKAALVHDESHGETAVAARAR